ncbi:MAG TPA: hypothetical protein VIN77_10535 [Aurantimonas sp.]
MSQIASMTILVAMVGLRTGAVLVLFKFLATSFGPDGFGQLSQVMAVAAVFYMIAGGGLTNGIVRNVAAAPDRDASASWLKAALPIVAIFAVALAAAALAIWLWGSSFLFPEQDMGYVLLAVGLAQVVVGAGNLALAYLSGIGAVRTFAAANAGGTIIATGLIAVLALTTGFRGAAVGVACLALAPAFLGLVAFGRHMDWKLVWKAAFVRRQIGELLQYSGSMFLAAGAVPLALVYMRADLAESIGWKQVGLWQSVARISDAYMQVFGVLFMNYLLPQLARLPLAARGRRLGQIAIVILALFLVGAAVFLAFSDTVLRLAFSDTFRAAGIYVGPQLLGDGLKLGALVFVYYFVAAGRASVQAGAEVLVAAIMVVAYIVLLPRLGALTPLVSYAIASSVLLLVMAVVYTRHRLRRPRFAAQDGDAPRKGMM